MKKIKRIGVLTGGGDCPGLNAVIRAIVKKTARDMESEVIGIVDGFEGLIHNRHKKLNEKDVSGILNYGGTILGTSNRANPYQYPVHGKNGTILKDLSDQTIMNFRKLKIDCLVCVGGDGTLDISHRLNLQGIPVIGIPKTIDNDVHGTDITFGFATAVDIATEGIDRLHTTAESHHRVMILEVMGRRAGWIALYAGMAGGGDIILIPEMPYEISVIAEKIRERRRKGKRFTIMVAAEGAIPRGGDVVIREIVKDSSDPVRLGGISFVLAKQIERLTGFETRNVVMGHLQRGGPPSAFDRILGTQLGSSAVDLIAAGEFGFMVGVHQNNIVKVPLSKVARGQKVVPLDHPFIKTASSMSVCFGI